MCDALTSKNIARVTKVRNRFILFSRELVRYKKRNAAKTPKPEEPE
jgi:hypothetical protein